MSDQATALGPKFFVLGAYVQASWMMDSWKARGVNTLVEAPEGHDVPLDVVDLPSLNVHVA